MPISKLEIFGLRDLINNNEMRLLKMPLYQSHKKIHATPLLRGAYNETRGWSLPANENPEDEGYLVVYDRGKTNEYVSWSPKDTFDKGNTEVVELSYRDRMLVEIKDLDIMIASLDKFIKANPIFGTIEDKKQELMKKQLSAMVVYAQILEERIKG